MMALNIRRKDKKAFVDFLHSWGHTRLYMKQAFSLQYDEQLFILQIGDFPGIKDDMRYYNKLSDDVPEEYAKKGYTVLRGYCDDWLALEMKQANQRAMSHQGNGSHPVMAAQNSGDKALKKSGVC